MQNTSKYGTGGCCQQSQSAASAWYAADRELRASAGPWQPAAELKTRKASASIPPPTPTPAPAAARGWHEAQGPHMGLEQAGDAHSCCCLLCLASSSFPQ